MVKIDLYTTPTCMPCKILKQKLSTIENVSVNVLNALDYPEKEIMATPYVEAYVNNSLEIQKHISNISDFVEWVKKNCKH